MDLVDIDALIDQLEGGNTSNNNNHLGGEPSAAVTTLKTDFVPVSNVFSSLNEYVNAEIDTEGKNIANEAEKAEDGASNSVGIDDDDDDKTKKLKNNAKEHITIRNPNYAYGGNLSSSDTDSEEEALQRFAREATTTAFLDSSTTTTSTSTSAPETPITPITPSNNLTLDDPTIDSVNQVNDDVPQHDGTKAPNPSLNGEVSESQLKNMPVVDKVRVPDTSLATSSYPNEANEAAMMSFSNTLSNDVLNLEGMSSISSMVEITSNYNKLKSDCRDDQPDDEDKAPEVASKTSDLICGGLNKDEILPLDTVKTDEKRHVVGFESTMDDVSDTELESYLQELEDEVQEKEQESSTTEKDDDGDNLSKASTIEFNELRSSKELQEEQDIESPDEDQQRQVEEVVEANVEEKVEEPVEREQFYECLEIERKPKQKKAAKREVPSPEPVDIEPPGTSLDPTQNQTADVQPEMFQSIDSIRFADSSTTEVIRDSEAMSNSAPVLEPKQSEPVEAEEVKEEASTAEEAVPKDEEPSTADEAKEDPVEIREQTTARIPRPSSLDIQNSTATPTAESGVEVVKPASPGHTPPPTARLQIDDIGLASTSSSDELASATSSPNYPANEYNFDLQATSQLGKVQPFWVPDKEANNCMQCNQKFSLIKRRHHCRACGQLLCSSCCCLKAKLEYMGGAEARVCIQCDHILSRREAEGAAINGESIQSPNAGAPRQPNPNNPMEYCSTLPPHQQVSASSSAPISVMVPVGVLKRQGQPRSGRKDKSVVFSDGIRPGTELAAELDNSWGESHSESGSGVSGGRRSRSNRVQTPPGTTQKQFKINIQLPPVDPDNKSYIPRKENALPPIYTQTKTEFKFADVVNDSALITRLQNETLQFAIQRNFYVFCKILKLSCCVNKTVINFTTRGLHHVGQDEIIILLEMNETNLIPKDIFLHFNEIYNEADKGNVITELGFTMPSSQNFLGSKEHGGFLYIRPSFQCLQNIILPESPYLIGVLIHRWEVPWAKIFPLRLMLRLGALYRYYPSPHISVRCRDSVYAEIAQTIINFLADFRTYSYTIPTIRGLVILMEDRFTRVLIPRNRYDQVMKAINNSSDHILALTGNFSKKADGHLVCIQNTEGPEQLYSYSTQAINIQGQPRKVTGASFIVLNGALKTTSGLVGKCNIVEDGLMVQILPSKMVSIREALKNMKDCEIICGPVDAAPSATETVSLQWTDNDLNFNIGVFSPIDKKAMDGIPSIRVHRGLDFSNANHMIRWTEVFILKSDDDSAHGRDPVDISRVSEQIARNTCQALVSFLDLLAANDLVRIGLRVTLDPENVCYEAGSKYARLAPLYMNALDNELIATLDRQASNLHIDTPIILELIFHILDK